MKCRIKARLIKDVSNIAMYNMYQLHYKNDNPKKKDYISNKNIYIFPIKCGIKSTLIKDLTKITMYNMYK
jgi:hypothetical protein